MPSTTPATSTSCHRLRTARKTPRKPLAVLDLTKPGEAWAQDFLRRAVKGADPMWILFGVRRDPDALRVAVRWIGPGTYAVVTISLTEQALRWRDCGSEVEARAALAGKTAHAPRVGGGT